MKATFTQRGHVTAVRYANVFLRIYRWVSRRRGARVYPTFEVRWRGDERDLALGKRTRKHGQRFPTEAEARDFAARKAEELANPPREDPITAEAVGCISMAVAAGVPQEEATRPGFLRACVADSLRRRQLVRARPLLEAIPDFIADKKKFGLIGPAQVNSLKHRLDWLARQFPGEVSALRPELVWRELKRKCETNRTLKNYRDVVLSFLDWCWRQKFIGEEMLKEARLWPAPVVAQSVKEIWRLEELKRLFRQADQTDRDRKLIPYLAIGAFASVRASEMKKLSPLAIDMDKGIIRISGEVAKGRRSKPRERVVLMPENLRRWLARFRPDGERIAPYEDVHKFLRRLALDCGLQWLPNGLRRSAISHARAMGCRLEDVAKQAGHSAAMAEAHYWNQTADYEEGRAWFELGPETFDLKQPEFRLVTPPSSVAKPSRKGDALTK